MSALPTCDVCAGYGTPVSGKPCICGGSGFSHDEKAGLRRRCMELGLEVEECKKAISEAADLKRSKRCYQIMIREISRMISEERFRGMLASGQYSRGSGEVECATCHLLIRDHPELLPTIHLVCTNEIIKT